MENFRYDDWFEPAGYTVRVPKVSAALAYADECGIAGHDFFKVASESPAALKMWVSQELIVTGPFSQALLRLAALIFNVHLRARVMIVINGEHGRVKEQSAPNSHPWLLNQLRVSMNIAKDEVHPLPETLDFLAALDDEVISPLAGLAATGIGNERLILPEYAAVKSCFNACQPNCDYARFLDANIGEDMSHSEILADVASSLIRNDIDADQYYDAALRSVDARIHYYDRLTHRARNLPDQLA